MRLKAKRSARGSNHRSRARRGVLSLALAATALIALAFAASAQAVTYTTGSPLTHRTEAPPRWPSTSQAATSTSPAPGRSRGHRPEGASTFRLHGDRTELRARPVAARAGGLAVDPVDGDLYVGQRRHSTATARRSARLPAGLRRRSRRTTGTADASQGSTELTNVSTDHPLQVGEGGRGPGIADRDRDRRHQQRLHLIENIAAPPAPWPSASASPAPASRQGSRSPRCPAARRQSKFRTPPAATQRSGAHITARTRVARSPAPRSPSPTRPRPAANGVAISARLGTPKPQPPARSASPPTDGSGDILWPNRTRASAEVRAMGRRSDQGSFPVDSGVTNRPSPSTPRATSSSPTPGAEPPADCAPTELRLKKLGPDGEELPQARRRPAPNRSSPASPNTPPRSPSTRAPATSTSASAARRTGPKQHHSKSRSTAPAAQSWPKGSARVVLRKQRLPTPAPSTSSRSTKPPAPSTRPTAATRASRSSKTPRPRKPSARASPRAPRAKSSAT